MSDPKQRVAGTRPKIGPIDGDPVTSHPKLDALSAQQRALRLAVIKEFKAKKVKKYVEKQVQQINMNERVAEGIKFLFDEDGRPPPNMPMEEIVAERRQIEHEIRWFEAILEELNNRLVRVKEIEDHALDVLADRFSEE
ncbi:hypothetical protein [Ideonella sp.]|uniref:hypothetical protein n=1 Tax=Ideonella sp. TaxID=1929293 RepID=UPI003BB6CF3B